MRELFRAEGLPTLQNRVYATAREAVNCVRGDVVLVQDETSGLVFNAAFDPALLVYDQNYQNEQACSPAFCIHLEQVAEVIARHGQDKSLVEIGCGKGWFLEMLRQKGYEIIGVDPAYEGDAPHVWREVFTPALGLHGDLLILRHVLEHIPDPVAFLENIRRSNGGHGLIYIEVPCFDWILQQRAWFDIFYEHVNYFRLSDFERLFGNIIESGRLFGGQYLYVVADLASLRPPQALPSDRLELPQDFLSSVEDCVALCKKPGRQPLAVWGAASKGVIFCLYMQRLGVVPDLVVDINPAKQGKYLPATGLRVDIPAAALECLWPGALVLVMNGNYLTEIMAQTQNKFIYRTIDR